MRDPGGEKAKKDSEAESCGGPLASSLCHRGQWRRVTPHSLPPLETGDWAVSRSTAVIIGKSPLWAISPQVPTALGAQAERLGHTGLGTRPGRWAELWRVPQHLPRAPPPARTHLAALPPARTARFPSTSLSCSTASWHLPPRKLGSFS